MTTQTAPNDSSLTPMMRQYRTIKETLPDTVLLFRLGDFYEMFFEDAKKASAILNIALTARESGKGNKVPMCGVPYHAAEGYIARLIKSGNKVAVCDQTEDPKLAKGIVRRGVTRIITPGTVLDSALLSDKAHNYLAAIDSAGGRYGLSYIDISTGEFRSTQAADERELVSEIIRVRPAEIVAPLKIPADSALIQRIKAAANPLVNFIDDWQFDPDPCATALKGQFKVASLDGFGLRGQTLSVTTAGALIAYLKNNLYESLGHLRPVHLYSISGYMVLDAVSQRNLELVSTIRDGAREGTLLGVLDRTVTPMGGRTIKDWIASPLVDIPKIRERLDCVEAFVDSKDVMHRVRESLHDIRDIERIVGRLNCGAGNPRDLIALKTSLKAVPSVRAALGEIASPLIRALAEDCEDMADIVSLIERAIRDDAPVSIREGSIVKEGFSRQLDEIRSVYTTGRGWIAELQNREIERTGVKSLKVRYNKVFGYYIELSNAKLQSVPADYIRKQTLVNCERFVTEELKVYESKVLGAEERANALEADLFAQVRDEVLLETARLQKIARALAILDALASMALVSVSQNYVRPDVNDSDLIDIRGGRHPVVETLIGANAFVPNDLLLDMSENQLLIITGPNMAGKSTYIRQAALLVLMAQMGSFVPAESARVGLVDRIFTRVGASDDIASGQSTFMVEMTETANIINNATRRSLIILDEIGRGTSTFDGLSIAWAVCEYLHNNAEKRARTLFATHYHELTELELTMGGVKNYNIAVREWEEDVIFLRKIVRGGTDKSYGIHVAKLAGLPKEIIARAFEILDNLEEGSIAENGKPALAKQKRAVESAEQMSLFRDKKSPLLDEIEKLDVDNMTPLQALTKLMELKKKL
ncbi:MAG TPA: DNA mismatch repair protein MutS [bacterium]|nr:DNA mismatch repair protein MutS [bacterium]